MENNRARPPPRLGVGLLASSNVKLLGINLDAKAESSFVSQVSVIADMEQLESMINLVIKSTLFLTDLALRNRKEKLLGAYMTYITGSYIPQSYIINIRIFNVKIYKM